MAGPSWSVCRLKSSVAKAASPDDKKTSPAESVPMNSQLTGMAGVYYAAAELTRLGFIVSITARNTRGPDLLVMDQACQNAWSVQVKTNVKKRNSWRLGQERSLISSATYLFIFVTLNGSDKPDFMVVPSGVVAAKMKGGGMPYFNRGDGPANGEGWELFEATALNELTWRGAREVARQPDHFTTAQLKKALKLLKPGQENKLDRGHRKAIEAELLTRSHAPKQRPAGRT